MKIAKAVGSVSRSSGGSNLFSVLSSRARFQPKLPSTTRSCASAMFFSISFMMSRVRQFVLNRHFSILKSTHRVSGARERRTL